MRNIERTHNGPTRDPHSAHLLSSQLRRSTFVLSLIGCMTAAAGCAGSHESERPAATPASEPDYAQSTQEANPPAERDARDPGAVHTESSEPTVHSTNSENAPLRDPSATRSAPDNTAPTATNTPQPAAPNPVAPVGTPDADNTGKNKRDRGESAVTPVDQGNNSADIQLVSTIRKAVVADDSLSFKAKNVKIVTNGGQVVLRGPVNSAAEKARVEAHAQHAAGVGRVTSQLEIEK